MKQEADNIVTVMTKYIKNGKESVKFNVYTGDCWIERILNNEKPVIVKGYSLVKVK